MHSHAVVHHVSAPASPTQGLFRPGDSDGFFMTDLGSFLLLSAAVFSGAFVSGLAGFAFSAVAGGILLHILQPIEAVPLMMSCSVGVQATSLWAMRRNIQWRQSLVLVIGGLLGVPIALWLLHTADTRAFREGFGLVVAVYAAYMLFRPGMRVIQEVKQGLGALVGFGGGLIGGLTAMPGALPTIWCDLHGMPKSEQRAMVQPFIAAMQIFALALMVMRHDLTEKVALDFALSIPALLAGTGLGILAFRRVNEAVFRRVILTVLMLSGALLLL
jgi:uncharacterized membrane protein YfcA